MNTPPPAAPARPLAALARRWKWGVAAGLLGAGLGAGVGLASPNVYVGESRLAVGSESLDARVVAGYSEASQQLAADLARYVSDQAAREELREVLGPRADAVQLVAASPIPESSVLRVEVTASNSAAAREGATEVARHLADEVNAVTGGGPQSLLAEYTTLSQQVAEQEGAVQAAQSDTGVVLANARSTTDQRTAARQRLADAESQLAVLQVQQEALGTRYNNAVTSTPAAAGLQIVSQGVITADNRTSQPARYGLAGLGAGLVLALGAASLAERRRGKDRSTGAGTGFSVNGSAPPADLVVQHGRDD